MWVLKKFAAIFITILIIVIAIIFFFKYINTISIDDNFKTIDTHSLIDDVNVYSNSTGIEIIKAENEYDAYFMLGYLHAKNRLFQMDVKRRLAYGQISEVFGSKYIKTDQYLRSFSLKNISLLILKIINSNTLEIIKKYSDGINFYINENSKQLQVGFSVLDYKPKYWKPVDCIALFRLFAIEQSLGIKIDLTYGSIAEKIGLNKTLELLPDLNQNSIYVLDNKYSSDSSVKSLSFKSLEINKMLIRYGDHSIINQINAIISEIDNLSLNFGMEKNVAGCNIWALQKKQNKKVSTILANDFHSTINIPSKWYQTALSYGKHNIAGLTLPGIPFIFSGRNGQIAWGVSCSMIDDFDYFVEREIPNHKYYIDKNSDTMTYKYIKDTIKVKNNEDFIYYQKLNNRSNILSDHLIQLGNSDILDLDSSNVDFNGKYVFSYRWTGQEVSDELTALHKISKSLSWKDFKSCFNTWGVPSMNFVFSSHYGNIGLVSTGRVPLRNEKNTPMLPNPGWIKENDWKSYGKTGIIGSLYNPEKKYVAASNNTLTNDSSNHGYYDLPFRAKRIENLIKQYQTSSNYEYSNLDAQRMQMDVISDYSRAILNEIKPIISKNYTKLSKLEESVFKKLLYWDYLFSQDKIEPSIFNIFIFRMLKNTFEDELGKKNMFNYLNHYQYPYGKLLEIMKERESMWYDNVNTRGIESKTYIIMTSFKQAVAEMVKLFGTTDIYKWNYGKKHQLKIKHLFNNFNLINPVFAVSDIIIGGDFTTINTSGWNIPEPFSINYAASFRMIADMSEYNIQFSIPGGISGEPMSPNYSNQLHLWENGGYIQIPINQVIKEDFNLIIKCR